MGLHIYQHAIVGVKLSVKDLKKVVSPAVYHEQARYDTKTGEVNGHERVLVKEEKLVYAVGPYEFDELCSINFKDELIVENSEDDIYIGLNALAEDERCINNEFLDGSISLMQLESIMVKVKNKFFHLGLNDLASKVQLHFFTDISY